MVHFNYKQQCSIITLKCSMGNLDFSLSIRRYKIYMKEFDYCMKLGLKYFLQMKDLIINAYKPINVYNHILAKQAFTTIQYSGSTDRLSVFCGKCSSFLAYLE